MAVAAKHGLEASFLPKLEFFTYMANGMHPHLSLHKVLQSFIGRFKAMLNNKVQNGKDASKGPTPKALSDEAKYFMNGMLMHQGPIMLFTRSVPNSYRRYCPDGSETMGYMVWGVQNRSLNTFKSIG